VFGTAGFLHLWLPLPDVNPRRVSYWKYERVEDGSETAGPSKRDGRDAYAEMKGRQG